MTCENNNYLFDLYIGASFVFELDGNDYDLDVNDFTVGLATEFQSAIFKSKADCEFLGSNLYQVNFSPEETLTLVPGKYSLELLIRDVCDDPVQTVIGKFLAVNVLENRIKNN